ncbi:hypothetical protein IJI69_02100 [Candidatus Saccharibacteria bacterium]|nr:hypothetical protein [Candidatus Saccharibacteria bacterium]
MKKFTRFILLLLIILTAAVQVQAENISGYTASDGTKYDLIKGAFTFPVLKVLKSKDGRDIADISARFFYSDGFSAEDP